jgi:glycerol-3-phosphate dehydrogenase (NAD(P)+)
MGLARARGIEMPITEQMYAILEDHKPPGQAMDDLMTRSAKREN